MNRFDTYVPIKFDVPMFTPDLAALEALQIQKQKTLDDFRNQADLIASSIKDDPYDPTIKEKKIKDIMASKDAIVNEMLRNPSKGNSLLSQYQNTLKNDILFGDISKVNARALDYEQKIADLKTQPLWNDPIWRKGALEEIKNSYGDFQTEQGFGKTKGDDFAHTFYTVPERDAIINSYIDKVAHDQYDEEVRLRPELASEKTYDMWYSQTKHDKLSYDKLLKAALPQALADTRLQDFYETEGRLRGLGEGQGEIKLKRDNNGNLLFEDGHLVIDDNTLFGQALHGNINERVVDNSSTSYTPRSADKVKMRDEQAYHTSERLAAQAYQSNENALNRAFQHAENEANRKAQEESEIRKLALEIAKVDKANGAYTANTSYNSVPLQGKDTQVTAEVLNSQIKDIDTQLATRTISNEYRKALESQREEIVKQINGYLSNSPTAKKLMDSNPVKNADWKGTNLFMDYNTISDNNWREVGREYDKGNYFTAALKAGASLLTTAGLAVLAVPAAATDLVTHVLNINDYTSKDIEKGAGIGISPIEGYEEQMTKSILTNQSWEDFLNTPVGQKLKSEATFDNDWFGVRNSAKKHFDQAQQYVRSGLFHLNYAEIPSENLILPESKEKGDVMDLFDKGVKDAILYDGFTYEGKNLRLHLAELNNVKPEDITINETSAKPGILMGQKSIGVALDYKVKGVDGEKNFLGKLTPVNPNTVGVIDNAQKSIIASGGLFNPTIIQSMGMNEVVKNLSADVLKLTALPPSKPEDVGYTPTNISHPTYYADNKISIKKRQVGESFEYDILSNGEKRGTAKSPSAALAYVESSRIQAENNIQMESPEQKQKRYLETAAKMVKGNGLQQNVSVEDMIKYYKNPNMKIVNPEAYYYYNNNSKESIENGTAKKYDSQGKTK